MAAITYEKQYQFDASRQYAPPDNATWVQYQLWYLAAFLTGQIGGATQGLCTVIGSSDGVTAALDGVNRWTNVFTPAKVARYTGVVGGGACGWIALRFANTANGKQLYLTILNVNAAADSVTLRLSDTAPTACTTSNVTQPNVTTDHTLRISDAATTFGTARRVHGCLSVDGEFFYLLSGREGNNRLDFAIFGGTTVDYRSADTFPFYFVADYSSTQNPGVLGSNSEMSGKTRTLAIQCTAYLARYSWTNSYTPYRGLGAPDLLTGKYEDFPLTIWADNGSGCAYKGRVADSGVSNAPNMTTGIVVDDITTPKALLIGHVWLPYVGLPVL